MSASHNRTVLSSLAEASRCPSGLNATLSPRRCGRSAGPDRLAGVGVPQPHRVSALALASRCPSGLNATLFTSSVCPVRGAPIGWPVSASHSRTVWSSSAVAIRRPSGLNATPLDLGGRRR